MIENKPIASKQPVISHHWEERRVSREPQKEDAASVLTASPMWLPIKYFLEGTQGKMAWGFHKKLC